MEKKLQKWKEYRLFTWENYCAHALKINLIQKFNSISRFCLKVKKILLKGSDSIWLRIGERVIEEMKVRKELQKSFFLDEL